MLGDYKVTSSPLPSATPSSPLTPAGEPEGATGKGNLVLSQEKKSEPMAPRFLNEDAVTKERDAEGVKATAFGATSASLDTSEAVAFHPSFEDQEELSTSPDVMALCGNPNYDKIISINNFNVSGLDFQNAYAALRVNFNFPPSVKFPPLPVSLDKNITIYPLSGNSCISGPEYFAAKYILNRELIKISLSEGIKMLDLRKKYFIYVKSGTFIPFEMDKNKNLINPPFFNVINDLQENRRKWKKLTGKKSAMERIYKDLGNMLYGKTVSGISNKHVFDARNENMSSMRGSHLSNPMIGQWITGFVRALIAELLYVNQILGGKVTSVTTDGFVSNIKDLELKALRILPENSLLRKYRDVRNKLSGEHEALEIKTTSKGIMQWSTRGQYSLQENSTPIAAMTGFQKHLFVYEELLNILRNTVDKNNELMFLQRRLTGALDDYKLHKKVSMVSSLRKFRTVFDQKRIIIPGEGMKYTSPYLNIADAALNRNLINIIRTSNYSEQYTSRNILSSYNAKHDFLKYFIYSVSEFFN